MSALVNCVLAKEIGNYLLLQKHSVLNNNINEVTLKDSLISFLDCIEDNPCNTYTQVCSEQFNCNIVINFLTTESICKKPLISVT